MGRSVLLLLASTACISLGFDSAVYDKERFDPPDVYGSWWQATEECSETTGSFDAIEWYLASGIVGDGVAARARWNEPHEIIIVRGYEDDEKVVRHEMLHDLLRGDRTHDSPGWASCGLLFE